MNENVGKWVLCSYDRWYFAIYNDENSFLGWFPEIKTVNGKYKGIITLYVTPDLANEWPQARVYHGTKHTKITFNSDYKRDQWSRFLTANRRNYPRIMIKSLFEGNS